MSANLDSADTVAGVVVVVSVGLVSLSVASSTAAAQELRPGGAPEALVTHSLHANALSGARSQTEGVVNTSEEGVSDTARFRSASLATLARNADLLQDAVDALAL